MKVNVKIKMMRDYRDKDDGDGDDNTNNNNEEDDHNGDNDIDEDEGNAFQSINGSYPMPLPALKSRNSMYLLVKDEARPHSPFTAIENTNTNLLP